MCGEKSTAKGSVKYILGSPPRVRGKADNQQGCEIMNRITPACAGKSPCSYQAQALPRDHPRVCGEKLSCRCPVLSRLGSPPRVRGKGAMPDGIAGHHRITPACAGKREKGLWRFCEYKDHPRVCGEKMTPLDAQNLTLGSPPRVRGKGIIEDTPVGRLRITPACAGKSIAVFPCI